MPCKRKHRSHRRHTQTNSLAGTTRVINDSTRAIVGLAVLGGAAKITSDMIK